MQPLQKIVDRKIGNNDLKSVTYGYGTYVVTEKSGHVNYSTDLSGWNRVRITVTNLCSAAFGNNKFIVNSYGCILSVTGRTGRKFLLEIIPGKRSYLMAVFSGLLRTMVI